MINETTIKTQVLVVGAGPAGFAAAYTAAKNGAEVLIIEQGGDIGGISTIGLMSHWTGSCGSPLFHEILKRSAEKHQVKPKGELTSVIDPEMLKTLYLEMLSEVNCKILLYTFAEDAITDNNKIIGITALNKSGRLKIYADVVIDASGDGDIAARAGAEFILGRKEDNKMQPVTLMFKVGGVNTEKAVYLGSFESTYQTEKGELQALAKEHLPYPAGHVLLYASTLPGIVTCNMTNCVEINGTNANDLTKATIMCRNQMSKIIEFLHEYVPGYENCFLIDSASLIGVRETRHFIGKAEINENDILTAREFEDWVVWNAKFNFDVHNISGAGLDKTGVQKHFTQTNGYTIPYGCLLPRDIENLLLSGRNISGTHMAHSNFRAMPICVGIGEAGGAAAAIAVKTNTPVSLVDPKEIRRMIYNV